MKTTKKMTVLIATLIGSLLSLNTQAETRDYLLATAGTGGSFYPVGVGIATVVKLKLGTRRDNAINMSAITSQGSFDNVNIISKEKADFAIAQSLMTDWGWNGAADFQGEKKRNIRTVTALMFNTKQFFIRNEYVKTGTMEDILGLKGKDIVLGSRNSGGLLSFTEFLNRIGVEDPETYFNQSYIGFRQRAEGLINGNFDGINLTSGVPNSSATLAMANMEGKITLLSFSPEMRKELTTNTVWGPYTIAANTYPGQSKPVETIAQPNLLIVGEHVPEDVVYEVTKTLYENLPFLGGVHGSLKAMSLENALLGITVPLHPGAVRYYQEVGVNVPANLIAN